ncbi:Protein SHQ1 [Blattella germanica]|nr:Protein SHQ1 [Blattella germanica]
MLIPKFELAQSESKLFITVHAKYAKIEDADLFIEDCIVRFYCKPYSLQFCFTDSEGTGELSSSDVSDEENIIDLNEEEESLEQMQKEGACCLTPSKPKYGFGNRFYKAFLGFTHEILELLDLEDPDGTPKRSRSKLKVSKELSDFKEEHYLADLFEEEVTEAVINYQPVWLQENFDSTVSLTEEEFDRLKEIPMNVWSKDTRMSIYLGTVDILLAYCYDNRTTEGDPTSESAWTINKLSSTLSWLQKFKDLKSVLASFMRRSLCYPLYRNWNLSLKVVEDVESLLRCKKLYLQKCFLGIHSMFNNSEPRYMLNRIYIDDYCHWVAHADEKILNQIADDIKKVSLTLCTPTMPLANSNFFFHYFYGNSFNAQKVKN